MTDKIKEYFKKANIEYFAVLSYDKCIETGKRIIEREKFSPRSVIVYLLPYYTGEAENISRYAISCDYHLAIKEINEELINLLLSEYPNCKLRGYGDHSPIDERHASLIAGLGIAGQNGLILNEKYGSYVFVGDIITDISPDELGETTPVEIVGCEGCGLCKMKCPTGILRHEGTDCLSAITQRKGELSKEEVSLMKEYNTVWGCDLCQSCCPHNSLPVKTPVEFFYRERIPCLTRDILNSMTEEEFSRRAYAWRKRSTVERNLEILYGYSREKQ